MNGSEGSFTGKRWVWLLVLLGVFGTLFFVFEAKRPLTANESIWQDVPANRAQQQGDARANAPLHYRTVQANLAQLQDVLTTAQKGGEQTVLHLPLPNGENGRFLITHSPILPPDLVAKFPAIQTYSARGLDDPTATARLGWTPHGFHAIVITTDGTAYIDPVTKAEPTVYISYYQHDMPETRPFSEQLPIDLRQTTDALAARLPEAPDSVQLHSYRLAVAATGEYTQFHGGTVADGMAAVVTAVNRVNAIFEKELGVRLTLVAENDQLIYTNRNTDPYFNSTTSQTTLEQNQINLDDVVGVANYDVGHLFTTTSGGLAGIGTTCTAYKGWGITGLDNPNGDPVNIQFFAHELGHQFGAAHSFNTNNATCKPYRAKTAAYEPGSGSTLMSYAGICGDDNLQPTHDDYFHSNSYDEIQTYITVGAGATCGQTESLANRPPTAVAETASNLTIPKNTPFTLVGSGTDADGDSLTYAWEQFDLGPAGSPNSPSGNAPLFRSFPPTDSPERTFPRLQDLLNNSTTFGERLPTYTRSLTFRLTVRDGQGGVAYDSVQFDVTNKAGPFRVNVPNTAVTWQANAPQTVSWRVANSDKAPVNCQNVTILLSTDGGYSYPFTLSESTPNDGSAEINVPNSNTTQARLKVACANNIFFDISDADFVIEGAVAETVAITAVSLSGPVDGITNTAYSFAATVAPLSATLPITYSWSTTDHDAVIRSSAETTDTVSFSWAAPGKKVVMVSVENGETAVIQTHTIQIEDLTPPDPPIGEWRIFIPITRKE